jgi:hypothetical protein
LAGRLNGSAVNLGDIYSYNLGGMNARLNGWSLMGVFPSALVRRRPCPSTEQSDSIEVVAG